MLCLQINLIHLNIIETWLKVGGLFLCGLLEGKKKDAGW